MLVDQSGPISKMRSRLAPAVAARVTEASVVHGCVLSNSLSEKPVQFTPLYWQRQVTSSVISGKTQVITNDNKSNTK